MTPVTSASSVSSEASAVDTSAFGLEAIEVELLLEGIYRHYGLDFRQYSPASLRRRLRLRLREEGLPNLSALQALVLHNPQAMSRLLADLSISVSAMFRDPDFYSALRTRVLPLLRTYPFIRIWSAGCGGGEEVYSLAILLTEAGLYERTRIYATDLSSSALDTARAGIYPLDKMKDYAANYKAAGGERELADYYTAAYEGVLFDPALIKNVTFAQHNLASDTSFNEFHLIVCRNVLIYFAKPLQERVHTLFHESLVPLGVLALGSKESLGFSSYEGRYQPLDGPTRIYRRRQ
jgi:chemotaxis protein methyltransferase CheR